MKGWCETLERQTGCPPMRLLSGSGFSAVLMNREGPGCKPGGQAVPGAIGGSSLSHGGDNDGQSRLASLQATREDAV